MKKGYILFIVAIAMASFYFTACQKDDFTEKDAINLQRENTYSKVDYSISFVDASKSTLKSSSALSGLTISLTQDGNTVTRTDSSGLVSFTNLKYGSATVKVVIPGFSEVNYVVDFTKLSLPSGGNIQASNIIPLIPLSGTSTATISGRVTCETDLTNKVPEAASNAKIIATINTGNSSALPNLTGILTSISYDGLALEALTDANGNYSLTVPATLNGLTYDLKVADFTADQKVLMTSYKERDTLGLFTIPAFFGSNASVSASVVPSASPVIVNIGAPDYTFTPAAAVAVMDNPNGIENIQITDNGDYYTPNTIFVYTVDNSKTVSTIAASASFSVNEYGRVKTITVNSTGSGYPATADNLDFTIPYVAQEAVVTVSMVSGTGAITGINVTSGGKYFINDPSLVFFNNNSGNGTGAKITPNFLWNAAGYFYVSSVSVDPINQGSGYVAASTFNVKVNASLDKPMNGKLHLTKGVISAVNVSNQGANYVASNVNVIISDPGAGGTTATAIAEVFNGKITAIRLLNYGSGYATVPTVTIVNKVEKIQAKALATVDANGNVSDIQIKPGCNGSGYLTAPAVSIVPVVPGIGSGAIAYATLNGASVGSVILVNKGNSYIGMNIPATAQSTPAAISSGTVKGSTSTIVNISLGTGKRSIER